MKDIIFKTAIAFGNETLTKFESFYEITYTSGETVLTKAKSFVSYGNPNPEDDVLTQETINQIQSIYLSSIDVLIDSLDIPEGATFVMHKMRVEDYDLDGDVDKIESYYSYIHDDLEYKQSKVINDLLSPELITSIESLFDYGRELIKTREGI